jgi:anti-sigma regulatory factor (Ser/Thr protein kinase)
VFTIVLPDTEQGPLLARHYVGQFGNAEELRQVTGPLTLIASELVTNAVQHGGGPIELRLEHSDGVVTIEVVDGDSTAQPLLRSPAGDDGGGRGLRIVETLAREWGVRATETGKIVWASLATDT